MKIKEISVSYSESVNTGNFENVKWDITKILKNVFKKPVKISKLKFKEKIFYFNLKILYLT